MPDKRRRDDQDSAEEQVGIVLELGAKPNGELAKKRGMRAQTHYARQAVPGAGGR